MAQKDQKILIIGTGTFGASTAYHLAKRGYTNITCIDKWPYPSLDSAGYDINKIIRTEYDEPLYAEMALEAIQAWRTPMYTDIFHETGWILTTLGDPKATDRLRKSYENLKNKGQAHNIDFVSGKDEIVRHVPQLKNARDIDNWKGLWNKQAGWAHAANAIKKVADEAAKMGVRFISGPSGEMIGLETEGDKVTGIRVKSGEAHHADKYILSTGAASPALLPELHTELWSKCWTYGLLELTEEEAAQFKNMPVVLNHELGFFFEPSREGRLIKICNEFPGYQWRKGEYTDANGRTHKYSVPRYASEYPEDGIPEEAMNAIKHFISTVIPQFEGREIKGAKVCWCTDSPDAHYLIANHPKYPGGELLLATGDSGHAFKMLPIIGKYISNAVEGNFKPEWRYGNRKHLDSGRPGDEVKDLKDVGIGGPQARL
ncbi:putative sarcosine oxidase [Aureobasidium pullulans]|uniref:Putative sarcosine oxidase n=1 Tax=Aureobasidium pullulans TaxID=5580 RepID=A0A4S9LZ94_AURPU|nr:putative sarcosine oxidase [Aureobasidium pullulans]